MFPKYLKRLGAKLTKAPVPVPERSTRLLFAFGLLGLAGYGGRIFFKIDRHEEV